MNKTFLSDHFVIKAYSKDNVYYLKFDSNNSDNAIKFINSKEISDIYSISHFKLSRKIYETLKKLTLELKEKYKDEYEFKIEILSLKILSNLKEYIESCDGCFLQGIDDFNCNGCIEEKNDISIRSGYIKRRN